VVAGGAGGDEGCDEREGVGGFGVDGGDGCGERFYLFVRVFGVVLSA
jgi:hypothetical protein